MTAEDDTAQGSRRARQNVVHEAGLFQGRLGFEKVIILQQREIEEFSDLAGLLVIPFEGDRIEETFYELRRKMEAELEPKRI
jgi:predicted nucleotide-binding protein